MKTEELLTPAPVSEILHWTQALKTRMENTGAVFLTVTENWMFVF